MLGSSTELADHMTTCFAAGPSPGKVKEFEAGTNLGNFARKRIKKYYSVVLAMDAKQSNL